MSEAKTVGDAGVRAVEALEKAGSCAASNIERAAEKLASAIASAVENAGVPAKHVYAVLVRRRRAIGRAKLWEAISAFGVAAVAAIVGVTSLVIILVTKPALTGIDISGVGVVGCIVVGVMSLTTIISVGVGLSSLSLCWANLTEPEGAVIQGLMDDVKQLLR